MPLGKAWAQVLLLVHARTLITTEGVACELKPLKPGKFVPTSAVMASTDRLLVAMKGRGILRQAHPWTRGKLWAVTEWGREVARALDRAASAQHETGADVVRRRKRRA